MFEVLAARRKKKLAYQLAGKLFSTIISGVKIIEISTLFLSWLPQVGKNSITTWLRSFESNCEIVRGRNILLIGEKFAKSGRFVEFLALN